MLILALVDSNVVIVPAVAVKEVVVMLTELRLVFDIFETFNVESEILVGKFQVLAFNVLKFPMLPFTVDAVIVVVVIVAGLNELELSVEKFPVLAFSVVVVIVAGLNVVDVRVDTLRVEKFAVPDKLIFDTASLEMFV